MIWMAVVQRVVVWYLLFGSSVSWLSKKQTTVAIQTTLQWLLGLTGVSAGPSPHPLAEWVRLSSVTSPYKGSQRWSFTEVAPEPLQITAFPDEALILNEPSHCIEIQRMTCRDYQALKTAGYIQVCFTSPAWSMAAHRDPHSHHTAPHQPFESAEILLPHPFQSHVDYYHAPSFSHPSTPLQNE